MFNNFLWNKLNTEYFTRDKSEDMFNIYIYAILHKRINYRKSRSVLGLIVKLRPVWNTELSVGPSLRGPRGRQVIRRQWQPLRLGWQQVPDSAGSPGSRARRGFGSSSSPWLRRTAAAPSTRRDCRARTTALATGRTRRCDCGSTPDWQTHEHRITGLTLFTPKKSPTTLDEIAGNMLNKIMHIHKSKFFVNVAYRKWITVRIPVRYMTIRERVYAVVTVFLLQFGYQHFVATATSNFPYYQNYQTFGLSPWLFTDLSRIQWHFQVPRNSGKLSL